MQEIRKAGYQLPASPMASKKDNDFPTGTTMPIERFLRAVKIDESFLKFIERQ